MAASRTMRREDALLSVPTVEWFHTIELPGGIVTPGRWDTRTSLTHLPIPPSLRGKRCLDIGTWDGYWAFELEHRGAAEVIAIDVRDLANWDWPANAPEARKTAAHTAGQTGFEIAHDALGSHVEHRELSVYDLDPQANGQFDFVFMGTVLMHLRDPVGALMAVRSVTSGAFVSADVFSLTMSLLSPTRPVADLNGDGVPAWWAPNVACRKRWLVSAGFQIDETGWPYLVKSGPGAPPVRRASFHDRFAKRFGVPHMALLAH
jgi:tRNA (mo5U34)-methyltransferase